MGATEIPQIWRRLEDNCRAVSTQQEKGRSLPCAWKPGFILKSLSLNQEFSCHSKLGCASFIAAACYAQRVLKRQTRNESAQKKKASLTGDQKLFGLEGKTKPCLPTELRQGRCHSAMCTQCAASGTSPAT